MRMLVLVNPKTQMDCMREGIVEKLFKAKEVIRDARANVLSLMIP